MAKNKKKTERRSSAVPESANGVQVESNSKSPRPESITIIGPAGGESRGRSPRDVVEQAVDPETVRASYKKFLAALQAIVNVPSPVTTFTLEEVEFSAEISANGEFKLMGTGMGVEAKGGVKFTLRRESTSKAIGAS